MEDTMTVEAELCEAAGTERKAKEAPARFRKRLHRAVEGLEDGEFKKLSKAAKKWMNDATSAKNNDEDLPALPDEEAANGDEPEDEEETESAEENDSDGDEEETEETEDEEESEDEESEEDDEDEEEEAPKSKKSKVKKEKPAKKAKAKKSADDEDEEEEEEEDDEPKKGKKKSASAGKRGGSGKLRELIVEAYPEIDVKKDKDKFFARVQKMGYTVREQTASWVWYETLKTIELLKEAGKIRAPKK